jgi:hypothetical protein
VLVIVNSTVAFGVTVPRSVEQQAARGVLPDVVDTIIEQEVSDDASFVTREHDLMLRKVLL